MWPILNAAGFLNPPLAFTYRKNDGYVNFNAISVYKVYLDFWVKILGRLFVNAKQTLAECFKSFFNSLMSGGRKSSYILKQTLRFL